MIACMYLGKESLSFITITGYGKNRRARSPTVMNLKNQLYFHPNP